MENPPNAEERLGIFENRYPLSIPASVTVEKFLDFLGTNTGLEKIEFGR